MYLKISEKRDLGQNIHLIILPKHLIQKTGNKIS